MDIRWGSTLYTLIGQGCIALDSPDECGGFRVLDDDGTSYYENVKRVVAVDNSNRAMILRYLDKYDIR